LMPDFFVSDNFVPLLCRFFCQLFS